MQLYDHTKALSTKDPQEVPTAPPFSLDTEQAVLGALLIWNNALEDVAFLEPHHFFDNLHGGIFESICRYAKAGRSVGAIELAKEYAGAMPIDGALTVPQYIGTLGVKAAMRRQVADYARTIVDLHDRRNLILIGEDLAQNAREASFDISPRILIEEAEHRLYSLAEHTARSDDAPQSFREAAATALEDMGNAYRNKFSGVKTHITDLDRKLGGLQPTDLIILAGRPSMGKTALATNIAFNAAHHSKTPVGFFSLEMSASQLATRVLSERVEIPSHKLRKGDVTLDEFKRVVAEAENLSTLPIHTDQLGGISIAQLVARARRMKRKHGVGLIVVDYLQLMQASKRRENRVQDITEITTGLKALAKELSVPVLALSQLSRETEKRENKRPQLSDLRESGSIEQDADVVLFVYREEYYLERAAPSEEEPQKFAEWQGRLARSAGKAEIIIGKHRHGELGVIPVAFAGDLTRFSNLAGAR